jgi:hypothetical protein
MLYWRSAVMTAKYTRARTDLRCAAFGQSGGGMNGTDA